MFQQTDNPKDILIGCEKSGMVRDAFVRRGHNAFSCDLLPSEVPTNRHFQCDVRDMLATQHFDMLIVCHPPCTRLCNSGVRWFKPEDPPSGMTHEDVLRELDEGCELFGDLLNADVPMICVENPIMHWRAKERIRNFRKYEQIVNPWEFGHDEDGPDNVSKKTCLWLQNLPTLVPTGTLDGTTARQDIHLAPPSPTRSEDRSRFFPAFAEAMAEQWGELVH